MTKLFNYPIWILLLKIHARLIFDKKTLSKKIMALMLTTLELHIIFNIITYTLLSDIYQNMILFLEFFVQNIIISIIGRSILLWLNHNLLIVGFIEIWFWNSPLFTQGWINVVPSCLCYNAQPHKPHVSFFSLLL